MRALILSGAGRYADPWHPFADTSERLADILRAEGLEVEISGDVDARMASLAAPGDDPDLLVVNIGDPARAGDVDPEAEARGREGLLAFLGRGGRLLASHVSLTSLRGIPEWETIAGAIWVRGTSFHPEYGRARILVHPDRHDIVAGLADFEVEDERYTDLRVAPDVEPLASHEHDGRGHPLIWTRHYGRARVVVDALGHDAASYDSETHRLILARAVRWLLA
ncbi:ThuA domain-containing protein [Leifsonia sp. NPDC080035]|uniref:ThuA domain-containing protein n=1 Tax=Leifsonia sp. NPDC080035 TaxID=3143936 RepID=A0AAU7G9G6_9MICO